MVEPFHLRTALDQLLTLFQQSASALLEGHLDNVWHLNQEWTELLGRLSVHSLEPVQRCEVLLMNSKRLTHRGQYNEITNRIEEAENNYRQAIDVLKDIQKVAGFNTVLPISHLYLYLVDGYGFLVGLYRKQLRRQEGYELNQIAMELLPTEWDEQDVGYSAYLQTYTDTYNNQALLLTDDKRFDEATALYEQVLSFAQQRSFINGQIQTLNNLGALVYWQSFGKDQAAKQAFYRQAIDYFIQVHTLKQKLESTNFLNLITDDLNLGTLYCGLKEYPQATASLGQALEKLDRYINQVKGEDHVRLLENQAFCEQMLVSALVNDKQNRRAFTFLEARRSRSLAALPSQQELPTYQPQGNEVRQVLKSDQAFISFSNTDQDKFVVLVVRAESTAALEIIYYDYVNELYQTYQKQIDQMLGQKTRFTGSLPTEVNQPIGLQKRYKNYNLLRLIHWFRLLVERQDIFELTLLQLVSQQLYALFVQPLLPYLTGINQLIVSTDASLGYLPFELLCAQDKTYLIETYTISYSRTLNHLVYFRQRSAQRVNHRRLLIVKNSKYRPQQAKERAALTPEEQRQIRVRYHRNALTDEDFNKLTGQIDLPSLTHIEEEVKVLRQVVPQADILTNEPLTKQAFLEMIQQGKLADYQCLHFALHGVAYPDLPNLSSLVFYHPAPTLRACLGIEKG